MSLGNSLWNMASGLFSGGRENYSGNPTTNYSTLANIFKMG
jgi:hypothetical protein